MNDPWNPNNYNRRVPNNEDPISMRRIKAGEVYYTIPTSNKKRRVTLNRKTLTSLIKSANTIQGLPNVVDPWTLLYIRNLANRQPIFINPWTRQGVSAYDINVHAPPNNYVRPKSNNSNSNSNNNKNK